MSRSELPSPPPHLQLHKLRLGVALADALVHIQLRRRGRRDRAARELGRAAVPMPAVRCERLVPQACLAGGDWRSLCTAALRSARVRYPTDLAHCELLHSSKL